MKQKKTSKIEDTNNKKRKLIYAAIFAMMLIAVVIVCNLLKTEEVEVTEYTFTKEGELSFLSPSGNLLKSIDIEFADTDYDRQLGLMFRKKMKETEGMLFIFPIEEMQSFWMRNTYISLDVLFVDANFKIVTVHKNSKTLSDQSYPSSSPAKYVVEVIAGFTSKYGVKEGDYISFKNLR